jgi:hypothetical protein
MGPHLSDWYLHFVKNIHADHAKEWLHGSPKGEKLSWDMAARHQFSIFGGEDTTRGWTFLRKFLDVSGF